MSNHVSSKIIIWKFPPASKLKQKILKLQKCANIYKTSKKCLFIKFEPIIVLIKNVLNFFTSCGNSYHHLKLINLFAPDVSLGENLGKFFFELFWNLTFFCNFWSLLKSLKKGSFFKISNGFKRLKKCPTIAGKVSNYFLVWKTNF